jgi:hypothetical protein
MKTALITAIWAGMDSKLAGVAERFGGLLAQPFGIANVEERHVEGRNPGGRGGLYGLATNAQHLRPRSAARSAPPHPRAPTAGCAAIALAMPASKRAMIRGR